MVILRLIFDLERNTYYGERIHTPAATAYNGTQKEIIILFDVNNYTDARC